MSSIQTELNKFMLVMLRNSIEEVSYKNKVLEKMLELIDKLPVDLDIKLKNPDDFDYHEYYFSDKIYKDSPTIHDMTILDDELALEILFKCNPVHKNYIDGNILHLGKMIKENVPVAFEAELDENEKRLFDYKKSLKKAKRIERENA